jgi:ribosomal protein S18 acetylase RimI-like enzyme
MARSLPSITDDEMSLERLLERDPQALVVAEEDNEVVGSLIAGWDGWRGSFYRLAVHPGHRRRGLGTALLREGERRLAAQGVRRVNAIVAADEPLAMAFWRAAGYERQERRARFVRVL